MRFPFVLFQWIYVCSFLTTLLVDTHEAVAQDEITLLCETKFIDEKPVKMGPEWFIIVKPQSQVMQLNWNNKVFSGQLEAKDNYYVSYINTGSMFRTHVMISRTSGKFSLFTEISKGELVDYVGGCKTSQKKLLF